MGIPTLIALLIFYAIYRTLYPPVEVAGDTKRPKSEKPTKKAKPAKKANPLLSALATVCLIVVLYLILFTTMDNWPLVVLFALVGLAFASASRK